MPAYPPTGQTGSVAWVVIIPDDLYTRLNAGQMDALRNAALESSEVNTPQTGDAEDGGSDTVFNACMYDMAKIIRQYIASNPRNRLSQTDASVPPELKNTLIWLVLQEMIARLSIAEAIALNDDQQKCVNKAWSDMNKLREVRPPFLTVATPVDPEPNPELTAGVVATSTSDRRQFTRHSLRDL